MNFSALPRYATKEEERRKGLEDLAGALRIFGRMGFTGEFWRFRDSPEASKAPLTLPRLASPRAEGISGHCTLRDPILTDHFWVNPLGLDFGSMCVSDLLLISPAGDIVMGGRPDRQQ